MSAVLWQTASGLFRGSIAWEYTLPLGIITLLGVGFALLLFLQWRDLKSRVPTSVRCGLCLLRGLVYLLILVMLLNPTFILQKVLRLLPSLAVVVDTSGSMTLPEPDGKTRLQQAVNYLHQGSPTTLDTLTQQYQVKFYQFDESARAFSAEHLDQLQGGGRTTDLTGSLTALLEDNRATPPVGVLLFSDGAQHDTEKGLEYLRQSGVPVVTVGLGTPDAYRDIRIASVQSPSLTFLHYPVDVHATLQVWGYRGERIPVVLKREGRVVATQTVEVTEAQFQHQVDFEIVPEETGEFTYSVSVAPRLGEVLTENNQRTFPISVVRDKIRVLLVCGTPTWNYRFLREALKQDPSVDMVSFVILRTPTDVVNVPENQLSLIPFPTRRLFTQELQNFDLIIFENFSFQLYFPWYYLENVRTYVNEGGAFAMIGGAMSFAQGGYTGTPIEEILPVTLGQNRSDYRAMTQRLVLTPEGKAHPITRLSVDTKENEHLWETLPELDALNIVAQAKPAATVLGVSSGRVDGDATAPLLAVQRVGKGRTLALMSDYIWKWNFQLAGQMDSNQYYLQFIRQLTRWLIHDPVLKQVRIMADATEFHLGSEVTGTIQILQDDYRPAPDAAPRVLLHTPAGADMPVESVPTATPGEFRYRFRADEVGLYSLDVQTTIGAETHEADRILLRVYYPGDEYQQAAPNHVFLKHVAEQTGSVFFALHDSARPSTSSLVEFFGGVSTYKILEETRQRVRETLPLFCLLLVCLGLEWLWRRRAGLF